MKEQKHTSEYVKKLAKKIKKEEGVPHFVALDIASVQCGFSNWKHFVNARKDEEQVEALKIRREIYPRG